MAQKITLDFDCPQYVDFEAELDGSEKDDVFFDCKDHPTPKEENLCKSTPLHVNKHFPSKEEENRLMEKMTTALSIIENTPKLKMPIVRGKLLAEQFSSNLCQPTKSTVTVNTVPAAGLLRSKSIARLNKIVTENHKFKGLGKRSSSLNDLRPHKKQTYPTTPMCLKRTKAKTRGKIIKSSEELELEEIAKLQQQLKEHLRYNEMSLKRLKLKPRPCGFSKNMLAKAENKGNKGLNPCTEKLNATAREPRRNIHTMNHILLRNEAMKIDNIIKGQSTMQKFADIGLKDDINTKHPSVSFAGIGETNEKIKVQTIKKNGTAKKIGFHSGLVFHDNVKKNTIVQPFSFDAKIKENFMNAGIEQKSAVSLSNSSLKYKVDDGKENMPCDKLLSTLRKPKGMQNTKCDIVKQLASLKKIGRLTRNPVKGQPLSENVRN